jgi:regulator of protease activity HflC (stomatin/prohibitin superfamily)
MDLPPLKGNAPLLSDKLLAVRKKAVTLAVILVVALLIFLMLNPFIMVGAGERGVVLNFGAVGKDVLGEGLHVRIPLMQRIIRVDVKVQKSQTDADAASRDLQDIHSTIAVNHHVIPDKANWLYQNIGISYKERVIDPAVQEVVKAVTARYTAVELITQREKVRSEIKEMLKQRIVGYNIVVDDLSIVNFKFSPQFTQAIEEKQTAEQKALKASRDLDRIKIEAEQKIAQAKAEAEALRLQKENVSPMLIQLRQIEVNQKMIEMMEKKWNGQLPSVMTGGSGSPLPMLDLSTFVKK